MPAQSQIPLLTEIFRRNPQAKISEIRISAGALAKSLGVTVAELAPLIREGYLRKRSEEVTITSQTILDAPPEAAVVWMRNWFLPAAAKPLLSVENMAELLGVQVRQVLPAAAMHDVPVHRDPALGFCFSIWAARQLLLRSVRARDHATRFDRIALLWRILEKDPEKAAAPPVFQEELEKELARVAKLPEPTRSLRTLEIMEALHDAELLADGVKLSPSLADVPVSANDDDTGRDSFG
jgi:hypothetical protein